MAQTSPKDLRSIYDRSTTDLRPIIPLKLELLQGRAGWSRTEGRFVGDDYYSPGVINNKGGLRRSVAVGVIESK